MNIMETIRTGCLLRSLLLIAGISQVTGCLVEMLDYLSEHFQVENAIETGL